MKPIMLLGPTASGKSAVALALAERFPIEIISVDSAQVYRGLDVGTAKPSLEERGSVRHHLIDILEPEEVYSAARFEADARELIQDILGRGRLPLLVGGTMLYARALNQGLHDLPQADPELRDRLDRQAAEVGWPALHARLATVDPRTAARLAPADSQRIQRALEIWELTGKPMSAWLEQSPALRESPQPFTRIALEPSDRSILHARINARFRAMMDLGLIDEVRALRRRPGLKADLPSMRSVGYRQVWEWLDQPSPIENLIDRATAATRQLAKRQLTWLRSDASRIVVDCLARDAARQVGDVIERGLENGA
jgi:tRNA dimethylallyltransferase